MRRFIAFFACLLLTANVFAFTSDDVREFTFENGLKMYFLQDTSTALVRIELRINAGAVNQNELNAGFFNLYANLRRLNFGADTVNIVKFVAPADVETTINSLIELFSPLELSDAELKKNLAAMKKQIADYAASPEGFINSAIDSRIYPASPWKTESGASPSQFASNSVAEARSILNEIAKNFYNPSNSTLFISGNLLPSTAQSIAERCFSGIERVPRPVQESELAKKVWPEIKSGNYDKEFGTSHKFVLYDKDFSADLTQVVIQYTNFTTNECDLAAAVLNENDSAFKTSLTSDSSLKILGAEYINVASAQKKNSSRLIIQSLLGKNDVSPVTQMDTFLKKLQEDNSFTQQKLQYEIENFEKSYDLSSDSSTQLMELISSWLATRYENFPTETFFNRIRNFGRLTPEFLQSKIREETPYIFVLVDSKTYSKYSKEFKNAGYEAVNAKNGAWYNQSFYKNLMKKKRASAIPDDKKIADDISNSAKRFIETNKKTMSSFKLQNGIPVYVKRNENTQLASIIIMLSGGELLFAEDTPGLATVMAASIAVNIRRQLEAFSENGNISGDFSVESETTNSFSSITILCAAKDYKEAISAAAVAFIYGDIVPALGDAITYDTRTQWRLKSGGTEFQLLCRAMNILYEGKPCCNLYQDTKDRPEVMDYYKIEEAYPFYLDSTRFSFVITGGVGDDATLKEILTQTFGVLRSNSLTQVAEESILKPQIADRTEIIQLRHLFLTDISAKDAGPQPAVLIPTTKFLDPIMYCLQSPDAASDEASLYNALLYEISFRIQHKYNEKAAQITVKVYPADNDVPFARLVFADSESTVAADKAYKSAVKELCEELAKIPDGKKEQTISRIENNWIMNTLSDAGSTSGDANLIKCGVKNKKPQQFLAQYESVSKASASDYAKLMPFFTEETPALRLYSADSKK